MVNKNKIKNRITEEIYNYLIKRRKKRERKMGTQSLLGATRTVVAIRDWSCYESIRKNSIITTTTVSAFSSSSSRRSSSLCCRWSPLTTIASSSSMSYDKELAAAKKAATLAARLCQVCHSPLSNPKTTTNAFFYTLFRVLYGFLFVVPESAKGSSSI
jgi:hypothetical protein